MENAKCILCGNHNAERNVFSNAPDPSKVAGGYKYSCPKCGLYALNDMEYFYVELKASDECKKKLSEYVKNHPDKEGKFKVITWNEIKKLIT